MAQEDIIQTTLKDSNYHLSLFSEDEISVLRSRTTIKETKGRKTPFVTCIVRDKDIQLKPEYLRKNILNMEVVPKVDCEGIIQGQGAL